MKLYLFYRYGTAHRNKKEHRRITKYQVKNKCNNYRGEI